jgi:hypothetical protein
LVSADGVAVKSLRIIRGNGVYQSTDGTTDGSFLLFMGIDDSVCYRTFDSAGTGTFSYCSFVDSMAAIGHTQLASKVAHVELVDPLKKWSLAAFS